MILSLHALTRYIAVKIYKLFNFVYTAFYQTFPSPSLEPQPESPESRFVRSYPWSSEDLHKTLLRSSVTIRQNRDDHDSHIGQGFTPLLHVSQRTNWDCGLACVLMVVRWHFRLQFESSSIHDPSWFELLESMQYEWMRDFVATESIWTIDLFSLLHAIFDDRYCVTGDHPSSPADDQDHGNVPCLSDSIRPPFPFTLEQNLNDTLPSSILSSSSKSITVSLFFSSLNLGVKDSYFFYDYYHDTFYRDKIRVNRLFRLAQEKKWSFLSDPSLSHSNTLDLMTLVRLVQEDDCIAITLVDLSIWHTYHPISAMEDTDDITVNMKNSSIQQSYSGHFVIVSGISQNQDHIQLAQDYASGPQENTSNQDFEPQTTLQADLYCMVVYDPAIRSNTVIGNNVVSVGSPLFVTPDHFERSWRSYGTDNDVILIKMQSHD